jgi:hypothetical protein
MNAKQRKSRGRLPRGSFDTSSSKSITRESGLKLVQPSTANTKRAATPEGRSGREPPASERWSTRPTTNHDSYSGSRTGIIPADRRYPVDRLAMVGRMVTPRRVVSVPRTVAVPVAVVRTWDKNPTAIPIMHSVSSHDHPTVIRDPPWRIRDCRLAHRSKSAHSEQSSEHP